MIFFLTPSNTKQAYVCAMASINAKCKDIGLLAMYNEKHKIKMVEILRDCSRLTNNGFIHVCGSEGIG
jgi:hypothetical protein